MGRAFTVFLAAFTATGSFLFGYDSGVMTDVIESKNFLAYFNTDQTSAIIGAINSTFSGGGGCDVLRKLNSGGQELTQSGSGNWRSAGRPHDGSIWPQIYNSDGCLHLFDRGDPSSLSTEPGHDPCGSHSGWLGGWSLEHGGANHPG